MFLLDTDAVQRPPIPGLWSSSRLCANRGGNQSSGNVHSRQDYWKYYLRQPERDTRGYRSDHHFVWMHTQPQRGQWGSERRARSLSVSRVAVLLGPTAWVSVVVSTGEVVESLAVFGSRRK